MAAKRKLLIDTDAGVDDAQAILMALQYPDVDVVGITCVAGNTSALQAGRNILRLLQISDRLDIPVYVGCCEPLLGDVKPTSDYHGADGFGDAPDANAPDDNALQEEHAVNALLRMSKKYQGELNVCCIGPLTNIAVAIRMDRSFGSRLKSCYIMGGNYTGKGNMTAAAEFNFYYDPEAAHVTITQLGSPITLVPWEVCEKHCLSWDFYDNNLRNNESKYTRFLKKIEAKSVEFSRKKNWPFYPADEILMAVFLQDDVIKSRCEVYATVEFKGQYTWGQMVVDWDKCFGKSENMKLVTDINDDVYKHLLVKSCS